MYLCFNYFCSCSQISWPAMGKDTQLVILWEQKSGFCHFLVLQVSLQSPSRDRNEPCGRCCTYSSTCSCWIGSGWEKSLLIFGKKKLKASLFLSLTSWCHRVDENIEHFSWGKSRRTLCVCSRLGCVLGTRRCENTWTTWPSSKGQKKPARLEYLHTEVVLVLIYWFI